MDYTPKGIAECLAHEYSRNISWYYYRYKGPTYRPPTINLLSMLPNDDSLQNSGSYQESYLSFSSEGHSHFKFTVICC